MNPRVLVVLLLAVISYGAGAFDVDGYRTGMTREQLLRAAQSRGRDLWETPIHGNLAIGSRAELQIDGTFFLCEDSLVVYMKSVDFDVDYVPTLEMFLAKYGKPKTISTSQSPWTGPGGGNVRRVEMSWTMGNDDITLSFSPEGRDGKGALRHNRASSIRYKSDSSCTK